MAGYRLDNRFIEFIVKNSLGYLTHTELDKLFAAIEKEINRNFFDSSAEANLTRIIEAQFDKGNFIKELLIYPHHIEILVLLSTYSNYLCDILTVHPEYISLVFSMDWLNKKIDERILNKEIALSLGRLKTLNTKLNLLKTLKMRYLLKIGVNDLLGNYNLEDVTLNLSILAKSLLSALFDLCFDETARRLNVKGKKDYTIISLGKLGGGELNYSSDVDLIAFYSDNYTLKNDLEYYELLSETIKLFISLSSEATDKGYLYRIDFRLRPDGKSSPLCRTLNDTIYYYEARGEDWEKQMLLKMNFLCGKKNLYNKFENFVSKYIYQNISTGSIKSQVKRMKLTIENQLLDEVNVKLFTGGIRDIEFSVQALQMINGKEDKSLRSGHTLNAIRLLEKRQLLSTKEAEIFKNAYIFYRRIEHFLQLMNDRQTHEIPKDTETLGRLSKLLGYSSIKKFNAALNTYRTEVRKIFDSIIESGSETDNIKIVFEDEKRAKRNLLFLQSGRGLIGSKEFDSRTISLFKEIEKDILHCISESFNPDRTLENFTKLVKASGFPSIFYAQCKSKTFRKSIISICSLNEYAVDKINSHPDLSELLLSSSFLSPDHSEAYKRFSTEQYLIILSIQNSLRIIDTLEFGNLLGVFVQGKIEEIHKAQRKNLPCLIIGLGSFATREMNLNSDIDLIFLIKDIDKYSDAQEKAQDLLKKIKEELSPLEVDCRLRPEGSSSQLIWDIDEYKNYLNRRARVWEFQAMLKINIAAGDETEYAGVLAALESSLHKFSKDEIKREMLNVYRKIRSAFISTSSSIDIKKDHGGIMTSDFISSYFSLIDKNAFGKILGLNIENRIEVLIKYNPDLKTQFQLLKENSALLKEIHFALSAILNKKRPLINKFANKEIELIGNFLGKQINLDEILNTLKLTGNFFNKVFIEQ